MKIAIITWFNNLNFGTALQALALQDYLKNHFNADVSLINYSPNADNQIHSIKQKLEHLPYKLCKKVKEAFHNEYEGYNKLINEKYSLALELKKQSYKEFMKDISFTNEIKQYEDFYNLNREYDLFICGSDQIWNPQILDKSYFLEFAKKPKIAYATSFGVGYIPKYARPYIQMYLKDYRAIGLRENACEQELAVLTDSPIENVCDPTILFDAEYWSSKKDKSCVPDEKYFVTYLLGDTKFGRKAIDFVSNRLKIKNVILPSTDYTLKLCDGVGAEYGPAQFISLIENAQFVLTDSFHATIFSIIFNKNFCTIKKHSDINPFRQNSRIEAILKTSGLEERLVNNIKELNTVMNNAISFDTVNHRIDEFRAKSKEFLNDNIK